MNTSQFLGAIGVVACAVAITHAAAPSAASDEAPAARTYMNRVESALARVAGDLSLISEAADAAAGPIIAGRGLAVLGDEGLADELSNRAGGFIFMQGDPPRPGDVLVYAVGVRRTVHHVDAASLLQSQLDDIRKWRQQGSTVIAIASIAQLEAADLLDDFRSEGHFVLDNHAPAGDDGSLAAPTFTVTNAAVAWTFIAELFAAATREGQTLAIMPDLDGIKRNERFERHWSMRFHDQTIDPIAKGELGRKYIKQLRGIMRDLATASWPALSRTAHRAGDTIQSGGRVYLRVSGPYVNQHHAGQLAADPGLFFSLDHDGSNPLLASPGPDDFVIAVGRSAPPGSEWWGEPQFLRQGGRGISWFVSAYLTRRADYRRREILVDLRWPEGDALVRPPGYDLPIAPASSIVAEAALWAVTAEVHAMINGRIASAKGD